MWVVITDDEGPATVSFAANKTEVFGDLVQVLVMRSGFYKGAVRLAFKIEDDSAEPHTGYVLASTEALIAADSNSTLINISTSQKGKLESVSLRLVLVNASSECIPGENSFGCGALISNEYMSTTAVINPCGACSPGQYRDNCGGSSSGSCMSCSAGTYKTSTGSEACLACQGCQAATPHAVVVVRI